MYPTADVIAMERKKNEPVVLLTASIIKCIDRVLEQKVLSENVTEELELFSKKFPVIQAIPFRLLIIVYHCLNNPNGASSSKSNIVSNTNRVSNTAGKSII